MQLSLLPEEFSTPKATTKMVTPSERSRVAMAQGSPPHVSSPSVRIRRYFWRQRKEVSPMLAFGFEAVATQPPVPAQSPVPVQPLYQVRKAAIEAPIGVEPLAKSGRFASSALGRSSFKWRKLSPASRLSLRYVAMRKSGGEEG